MYLKTFVKSECFGCTACQYSCPVNAIVMAEDEEGFKYPNINKGLCIECGLCERICPSNNPEYVNSKNPKVIASVLNDIEQRKQSTSGGVFYAIASWVLSKDGVVFGATIDDNHIVKHILVDKKEDLYLLRGSKYVQSDLDGIFPVVKQYLEQGRLCYFTGTGCQIAGLYAFLRRKYENLITSDLVCHGVPSQWLFNKHIEYLENKYKGKVSNYRFRDCACGDGCEIFDLSKLNGVNKEIRNPSYELSPYLYSFMYNMTLRHSCYDCKFSCIPRQGDITLADFWGVKNFFSQIDNSSGTSLVLINSRKGEEVLKCISSVCEIHESRVKDAVKSNQNIVGVSQKPAVRDVVYELVREKGYSKVVKNYFRSPRRKKILMRTYLSNTTFGKLVLKIHRSIRMMIK